jgi:hypothetical protein
VQADQQRALLLRIKLLGFGDERQLEPLMPLIKGQADYDPDMRRLAMKEFAKGFPQQAGPILDVIEEDDEDACHTLAYDLNTGIQRAQYLEDKRKEGLLQGPFPRD